MYSLKSHLSRLLIARVGLLLVNGDKHDAEILALRHQVLVLPRKIAARNLTMAYDKAIRFAIRDGAGRHIRTFEQVFTAIGADVITIPPGAPRANAFAEREVRTVRHELLDRTLIWNQRQLHQPLTEFVEHYNEHRPQRSLDQQTPTSDADPSVINLGQPIQRSTTCAGLINE